MSIVKIELTDKNISRFAFAEDRAYRIHDEPVAGFFLAVGKRSKTFIVQGDYWKNGVREFSARVAIGHYPEMTARTARQKARELLGTIARGERPGSDRPDKVTIPHSTADYPPAVAALTLREVWGPLPGFAPPAEEPQRTDDRRIPRPCRAIDGRLARPADCHLGDNPDMVATRHDDLTATHGPFAANGCMRTLRAIYNHAWKKNKRLLPPENPIDAVDWNPEYRRNTAMGLKDLPAWFEQLRSLNQEVRQEFHLFLLLSGGRPTATKCARRENLDLRRRVLHIPKPKGGEHRAFDIPLSRQMIRCLVRAIRAGRKAYPEQSEEWLFPADSASGHLEEHKEDRKDLAKWGNDLRQSYRTLATIAGVSEIDAKLLMNHALPGVNSGYITRHKLVEDHLRAQQQAISDVIMKSVSLAEPKLTMAVTNSAIVRPEHSGLAKPTAEAEADESWLALVA